MIITLRINNDEMSQLYHIFKIVSSRSRLKRNEDIIRNWMNKFSEMYQKHQTFNILFKDDVSLLITILDSWNRDVRYNRSYNRESTTYSALVDQIMRCVLENDKGGSLCETTRVHFQAVLNSVAERRNTPPNRSREEERRYDREAEERRYEQEQREEEEEREREEERNRERQREIEREQEMLDQRAQEGGAWDTALPATEETDDGDTPEPATDATNGGDSWWTT